MRCEACGASGGILGLGPREEMSFSSLEPVSVGYFACSVCWLVWKNPMPSEATLKGYYQSAWQSESPRPTECYISAGQFIARSTKPYRPPRYGRALDFGTRNSAFLDWIREGHWFSIGSPETADAGDWSRSDELREEFDLLVCTHVLEHVLAPRELLRRLAASLAQGGILYVEVPALEGGDRYASDNIHSKHLWHFSLASLLQLAISTPGLQIIGAETDISIPGWPVNRLCCRKIALHGSVVGPRDLWKRQTDAHANVYHDAVHIVAAGNRHTSFLYGASEALFEMLRADLSGTIRKFPIVDLFKAGQWMLNEPVLHPTDILPSKQTAYICTRNWCSVEPIKKYLATEFPHIEAKTPFFPDTL